MGNFYPRPPRGGRLLQAGSWQGSCCNFYPRPPRGGRQRILRHRFVVQDISIHALREEGDPHQNECACGLPEFLSTPSARRATGAGPAPENRVPISIHALREEGDTVSAAHGIALANFYPRPPRGGRHNRSCVMDHLNFISIHALREEGDSRQLWMALPSMISIHALREEGDVFPAGDSPLANDFYPRPPRGGRRAARIAAYKGWVFLSTPSARRAT